MKKDLEYYLNLPYSIKVCRIPDSEGGGYEARIPELGEYAIIGDGDTPEEAISSLEQVKKERFNAYLTEGITIPEPETESNFSGKFVLRLDSRLHKSLSNGAKEQGVSLNQYIKTLLEDHNKNVDIVKEIKLLRNEFHEHIRVTSRDLQDLDLRVQSLEKTFSSSSLEVANMTTYVEAQGYVGLIQPVSVSVVPNLMVIGNIETSEVQ